MQYHYEFIHDLIPLILDADDHWWPCHLATLAKVSHAWLYYVRKRLYACPDVREIGVARKLADTLAANAYLASLVRGISLQSSARKGPALAMEDIIGTLKAIRMLLGLVGLRKITVGGAMADGFIRLIGHPEAVEDLHIIGRRDLCSGKVVRWDETLTFGFPKLKKIRLSQVDLEMMWPSVEYAPNFTELILEDVNVIGGRLVEVLNGAKWLRCLHISCEKVNEEELNEVLASCAVECLHYEVRKTFGLRNPFSEIGGESGRTVRCLHLDGHWVDGGILDTLRVVFCKLEELVVGGRMVSVLASEWAEFVSSGALGSLRRLGLPWGTNRPPFAEWNKAEVDGIRAASVKRSISLIERGKVL